MRTSHPHDTLVIRPVKTPSDWVAARHIRTIVFVEEQRCPPALEWDHYDPQTETDTAAAGAFHLLGEQHGKPVATARWRTVNPDGLPAAKLERFAVLREARGQGIGRAMIERVLADARAAGHTRFVLHAQRHVAALYALFGFERVGAPFDEAGIEHVKMALTDP